VSTSPQSSPKGFRGPDVLGELLHSLSQPLTSLQCSLEMSFDEIAEQQPEAVSIALQQTERVIGMVQLMREYLDAEQSAEPASAALAPAVRSVVEGQKRIAELRDVDLRLVGTCRATLGAPDSRLRLALQYLLGWTIEGQPIGGRVALLLGEGPAGALLRVEGERIEIDSVKIESGATSPADRPAPSLSRARLVVATRILEAAGASLTLNDGAAAGFVLRIPYSVSAHPGDIRG
jgi:hypothetical protein